nr:site-specific DNA-methyltransferase [uncultured Prevotella sp.]
MEKLRMQSANGVEDNIQKIAQLFPDCVTETVDEKSGQLKHLIDFEKLKQNLSDSIMSERAERYQFTWPDKSKAILLANSPINATLRPCREESVDFDHTQNLYIEGDNLDVLKCLKETYLHKVKMIYIDPPYNTGKDFIYGDNFAEEINDYLELSEQFDEQGNRLSTNMESNGRFHTDWLNMIYPRLKVARDFLKEDGVIFISIDDHEVANLHKVCDEIFGASNFTGCVVLQTATDNNPRQINTEHEYILCYCKNKDAQEYWYADSEKAKLIQKKYQELKEQYQEDIANIQIKLREWIKENKEILKGVTHYDNVDEKGVFHDGDIANTTFGGYKYTILHPITHKPCKIPDKGFRFPEETMRRMIEDNDIMFGADETTLIKPKKRLENAKDVLRSVIYEDGRSSTKQFESLMARDIFQNPKSTTILGRLFNFVIEKDDYILDFFSGSGSSAEAAMRINSKHSELCAKFILVQIPENIDKILETAKDKAKKTAKNAIAFLDSIGKPHTICEIGKERIRRAGKKIKEETPLTTQDLDTGFRVLKLDSTNMENIYYSPKDISQADLFTQVDNVKSDRTGEDLLFQVMLELGATLDSKIESTTVDGKTIYNVAEGYLVACFDMDVTDEVVTAIAKMQPAYAVLRDTSMKNDATATNFEQIFKTYSPDTVTRIL